MEDTEFHIVFIRHAEATSNVVAFHNRDGIDIPNMDAQSFHQSLLDIATTGGTSTTVRQGIYLPDYLTQFGEESIEEFIKPARADPSKKLDVYRIFTSPLPRAVATAIRSTDRFEIFDTCDGQPCIESHPSLQEATNWPQDMEAPSTDASYIKLKGGHGSDAGSVLGEGTVDLSRITNQNNEQSKQNTVESRMNALTVPQSWEDSLEHGKKVREWLLDHRSRIVREHKLSGRGGPARVVVVVHGGMFNIIVDRWYCAYKKKNGTGDWEWVTSTVFRNLEAVVFRFKSDNDATMEEVPRSADYERIFGDYYRHLGVVEYINSNGTVVDQRRGHKDFIDRTGNEVRNVLTQKPFIMRLLVNWTGAKDAAKAMEDDLY
ncbi:hypothetical protein G7Z17_g4307 [Cylindrodendrum hubeiense]|uniref:Phosphoglycerate mutase-like protein n=1 Tax=Cylindrodendrum hubeiense TaxID=595255 RepID=A0A9P5LJ16_9HYPO|nr:hypothetical protein G7Z17_g4307 [Cylindrodendrum hubeiense]